MTDTPAFVPSPWRTSIPREWIDYNGHLRDAYYTLLASNAIDGLMEQLGLDRAYRESTGGTLFTLELHAHYLREIKGDDAVTVATLPLAADAKRLQVRCEVRCARLEGPAAVIEVLLLHVRQDPEPRAAAFPDEVARRLQSWLAVNPPPADEYGSRTIGLQRRGVAA